MIVSASDRRHCFAAALGFVAALPVVYFVTANVLKHELGLLPNIDIPTLHPALLMGGALAAVLVNLWSVVELDVKVGDRRVRLTIDFVLRPWNLAVLALAALFAMTLLAYALVENAADFM